jgi:diguanylate cyclase (GGDEF)-like protein/PAS domain S-box-containing protein
VTKALAKANRGLQSKTTGRKRAEEALRESEERLRAVVSNAPVTLFALDRDGVFTLSEGKGLEAVGLKPGEQVGQSLFDRFPNLPGIREGLDRVLSGEPATLTVESNGLAIEVHCSPTRGQDGEVSGVIGVALNVTERKRAEEALRESETKFRRIFDNVQDIYYRTDAQGIITDISRSVEHFGYTPEQLIGTPVLDVYRNPEERSALLQAIFESQSGVVVDYEIQLETADGRVFDTSVSSHLLRLPDGEFAGVEGTLRDITERKRMERALSESEAKYRGIFENVQDIYYRTDTQGIIIEISPSVERYGYNRDELMGTSVLEIYEDPEQRAALVKELLGHGEAVDYELRLKTGDGRVMDGSVSAHLLRGPDGAPVGFDGSIRDITERKRAEEALRESEAKYRHIFENVQDIYYRTDARGIITEINPSIERYGYTRDGLIGTQVLNVYESPEERSALLQALFERGVIVDYEIHLKTGYGDVRSASVSTQLLRGPDGAFAGVEGSLRDITERKRMEQALRESEAKYRHIFENVQDIYYRTDAHGIITEINPSIERYGYTRDGLIGTQVLNVYESQEERAALLKALFESEAVVDYEIHLKTGDGRVIETSASTHLLRGSDGEFVGVEGSLRDITERKRMEKALREQVRRDPLTGALNHGAIVEELKTLIASGVDSSSHAVAMIDVDGLKAINDTYGHQVGDAVLVAVADALSRDGAVVGRYGGDEFVALLPDTDREVAERYRQQVLAVLAEADLRDSETGSRVPIVASVGLAIYPTEAGRIEELIKLADSAMYAWRRQRPVLTAGSALSRSQGGDRAAKMVGQIVPLLTSLDDLNDKLRLVAHRLSVGGDYDAVDFVLFRSNANTPGGLSTFARLPEELVEAWNRAQRQAAAHTPIRRIQEQTRRAIIMDDPQHDERFTEEQRELMRAAGLRSVLIAPMIWRDELIGHLSVASKREAAFGPRDAEFLVAVATQVTAIARLATLVEDLQSTSTRLVQGHTETVVLLAAAAEAHDQATGIHLRSVRTITEALALELGYSEDYAEELGLAAVLHDIGKIRVPDVVLSTAGALTDEEWELMKQHTAWGQDFLSERPGFELAATIARSHHERWDGSGYPDGLMRESIPKAASIVSVADSFDAMTSDRPYKAARSVAAAVREIVACSGAQFSPKVVQALVRLHRQKRLARLHREALEDLAA